jgi:dienelactone hydrolase
MALLGLLNVGVRIKKLEQNHVQHHNLGLVGFCFAMDLASNVILTWISSCHPFIPGPKSPMERAADSLRVDLVC